MDGGAMSKESFKPNGGMNALTPQLPSYGGGGSGAGRFLTNFQMQPSNFQPRTYQAPNIGLSGLLAQLMRPPAAPVGSGLLFAGGLGDGSPGNEGTGNTAPDGSNAAAIGAADSGSAIGNAAEGEGGTGPGTGGSGGGGK